MCVFMISFMDTGNSDTVMVVVSNSCSWSE
jgi:hypothetical protein